MNSFFSTGAKFLVSQSGQVYNGVVGKVTNTIKMTFTYSFENRDVLNEPLYKFLEQRMTQM